MLEMRGLTAGYDGAPVLRDVSIRVGAGELVGLLGANNAGKSTLINVISGIVPVMSGALLFEGEDISKIPAPRRVELGLVQVPEGRLVFPQMSVRENLLLGGFNRKARPSRQREMDRVLGLFPRLAERLSQLAGTLSGGEQQMVAIGRGLMAGARLLMLDEPSLGLSPLFVQFIFEIIDKLHAQGMTILLVEQNLAFASALADRAHLMERGRLVRSIDSEVLTDDRTLYDAFVGTR